MSQHKTAQISSDFPRPKYRVGPGGVEKGLLPCILGLLCLSGCGTEFVLSEDTAEDTDSNFCPEGSMKPEPGLCGCNTEDLDGDGDGTPDCVDKCPEHAIKTAPGLCGCDTPDEDKDDDGMPDCVDKCPLNPDKTDPGFCGCEAEETDIDSDSVADCVDDCLDTSGKDPDCDDLPGTTYWFYSDDDIAPAISDFAEEGGELASVLYNDQSIVSGWGTESDGGYVNRGWNNVTIEKGRGLFRFPQHKDIGSWMSNGTLHLALRLEDWTDQGNGLTLKIVFWQKKSGLELKLADIPGFDINSSDWQEVKIDLSSLDWSAEPIDATGLHSIGIDSWEYVRFRLDEVYLTY